MTDVPPPPPPQAGTSTTPAITPSKEIPLALPFSAFQWASNKVRSPKEIASNAVDPLPLNGELTNPDVGAGCELECAVVEMVSVTAVGVVPLTVTDADGENVQLAAVGSPLVHANATALLNPSTADALRL